MTAAHRILWIVPLVLGFHVQDLGHNNIYIEKLHSASVYHSSWILLFALDTSNIHTRLEQITNMLEETRTICNMACDHIHEIAALSQQLQRALQDENQLVALIHLEDNQRRRQRRGAFDFIGHVSKSLFGTLDSDDLEMINKNLDKIFANENNLANAIRNQSTILRGIGTKELQTELMKMYITSANQLRKMQTIVNTDRKRIHLNSQLIMLSALLDELVRDIGTLKTAIAMGHKGIVHPDVLSPKDVIHSMQVMEEETRTRYPLVLNESIYNLLIQISKVTIGSLKKQLIYKIDVPVLEKDDWAIKRIHPIPQKTGDFFTSITVTHDLVMMHRDKYILLDKDYLLRHCIHAHSRYYCRQTHPATLSYQIHDCESEILKITPSQDISKSCNARSFRIKELLYKQLTTPDLYLVVPEKPIVLQTLCRNYSTLELTNPAILSSSEDCTLIGDATLMKIGGSNVTYTVETRYKPVNINYTISERKSIYHQLHDLPFQYAEEAVQAYGTTLDKLDDVLASIQTEHRIRSWTSVGWTTLQWISYICSALVLIYLLKRIGFFSCIPRLIPKVFVFAYSAPLSTIKLVLYTIRHKHRIITLLYYLHANQMKHL